MFKVVAVVDFCKKYFSSLTFPRNLTSPNVNKPRRPTTEAHLRHVTEVDSKWLLNNRTASNFLIPQKSGTRTHDARGKFLVPSSWAENFGLLSWALRHVLYLLFFITSAFRFISLCRPTSISIRSSNILTSF